MQESVQLVHPFPEHTKAMPLHMHWMGQPSNRKRVDHMQQAPQQIGRHMQPHFRFSQLCSYGASHSAVASLMTRAASATLHDISSRLYVHCCYIGGIYIIFFLDGWTL